MSRPQLNIRASPDDLKRWRAAAAAAGLSLSMWARRMLDAAAGSGERLKN